MQGSTVVERYVDAMKRFDWDTVEQLVHPDVTVRYPQSGEVIRGRADYLAMLRSYPGTGPPKQEVEAIVGQDETVQVSSLLPFGLPSVTVSGASDTFTCQTVMTYPDGSLWHGVLILRVIDGQVLEDTAYFAQPFEAPSWRSKFCEQHEH